MSEPKFKQGDLVRFKLETAFQGMVLSRKQQDDLEPQYLVRYGEVRHQRGGLLGAVLDANVAGMDTVEALEFELELAPVPAETLQSSEPLDWLEHALERLQNAKELAVGDADFDLAADIRDLMDKHKRRRKADRKADAPVEVDTAGA